MDAYAVAQHPAGPAPVGHPRHHRAQARRAGAAGDERATPGAERATGDSIRGAANPIRRAAGADGGFDRRQRRPVRERRPLPHPGGQYVAARLDRRQERVDFLVQPALVRVYGRGSSGHGGVGLAESRPPRPRAAGGGEDEPLLPARRGLGGHLPPARQRRHVSLVPVAGDSHPGRARHRDALVRHQYGYHRAAKDGRGGARAGRVAGGQGGRAHGRSCSIGPGSSRSWRSTCRRRRTPSAAGWRKSCTTTCSRCWRPPSST